LPLSTSLQLVIGFGQTCDKPFSILRLSGAVLLLCSFACSSQLKCATSFNSNRSSQHTYFTASILQTQKASQQLVPLVVAALDVAVLKTSTITAVPTKTSANCHQCYNVLHRSRLGGAVWSTSLPRITKLADYRKGPVSSSRHARKLGPHDKRQWLHSLRRLQRRHSAYNATVAIKKPPTNV
jgi:hypothetical protein